MVFLFTQPPAIPKALLVVWSAREPRIILRIRSVMLCGMPHGVPLTLFVFSLTDKARNPVIWQLATTAHFCLKPAVSVVIVCWIEAWLLVLLMIKPLVSLRIC